MNLQHTTIRDLSGNPAVEAMELSDCGGSFGMRDDCNAEMEAAFDYGDETDELTEREIDEMFVAEMTRRDREARAVFCGDESDPEPTPPAGALPADVASYAASAARYSDAMLMEATALADEEPERLCLDPVRREAWLSAMSSELLRRLDARQAA